MELELKLELEPELKWEPELKLELEPQLKWEPELKLKPELELKSEPELKLKPEPELIGCVLKPLLVHERMRNFSGSQTCKSEVPKE